MTLRWPSRGFTAHVDWLKCNIDAALFQEEELTMFSAILRDDRGRGCFIKGLSGHLSCCLDAYNTEAFSLPEALSWLKGLSI